MRRRLALLGQVRLPGLRDEPLRRFEAAVEQKRADQRFDDVADDILALARAVVARLLGEAYERRNPDRAPDVGAGLARDKHIVPARKIAFGLVRMTLVQRARHHVAEHAVAAEIEPLIAVAAEARMGERELEQPGVPRLVTEPLPHKVGNAHLASPV